MSDSFTPEEVKKIISEASALGYDDLIEEWRKLGTSELRIAELLVFEM